MPRSPITTSWYLARVNATLSRRTSARNPMLPCGLLRVNPYKITSRSPPWNESTVPTFSPVSAESATIPVSSETISLAWAWYGTMTAQSAPRPW